MGVVDSHGLYGRTVEPDRTRSDGATVRQRVLDAGEACDEGGANADEGACTTACEEAYCGDGLVWAGVEDCDEGAANADGGACTTACQQARCGDGLVWAGVEGCDEGAANADEGACTTACQQARCGDGLVWAGVEDCDEGAANADDAGCTTVCQQAYCGDGLVWAGVEDCEDGNLEPHDGCSPDCTRPLRLDLASADAKLVGEAGAYAGWSVSSAGDVDDDGFDDVLVGAPDGGFDVGSAYLVLGPVSGTLDLANADARLVGEAVGDWAGESVSSAGDVDGDGFDDLLVGADRNDEGGVDAGAAYLVLGPVAGRLDLANTDAKLLGEAGSDNAGDSVSSAGDVDGDGFDDLLVGAPGNDEGGNGAGAAYLVLGPVAGTLSLANTDAKLLGEEEFDAAGVSVSSAGDVDGDGRPDLLLGAISNDEGGNQAGAAYLVHGPVSGTLDLANADAKLVGEEVLDNAGVSVSSAGDVDGDGRADLLVGAKSNDAGGSIAGAAYLVHGPVSGTLDLANADAKLVGEASRGEAGWSVSSAGDVDDDGFDDVLVGAPSFPADMGFAGATYLVLGPVSGTLDLAHADARIAGEADGDWASRSVSSAGDVDGDGRADLLVGSHANGFSAGAAYLVLGSSL